MDKEYEECLNQTIEEKAERWSNLTEEGKQELFDEMVIGGICEAAYMIYVLNGDKRCIGLSKKYLLLYNSFEDADKARLIDGLEAELELLRENVSGVDPTKATEVMNELIEILKSG